MNNDQAEPQHKNHLKAIRLINIADGKCDFEMGKIPVRQHINVNYFFAQTEVDAYEKVAHPAPRRQYVITLKGKLRFKVSNGNTFIIEPGTILIANDTLGSGHTWEILDGEEWERLYIPLEAEADDYFILD
ncbi:cupin domain-containing protein [Pedobacter paludis]|uniref:AraC-type arabinose-binding/dimerisation domain-containing protein n=1 Tax=Pedobacter paludis TaxID=2203212 RepID=A0A317F1H4_9SPHI|nr:hypothetical protein [Pedobacter paludis]PWS31298.1 hypothetical protein DF947_11880 [Pedobacter paludis]